MAVEKLMLVFIGKSGSEIVSTIAEIGGGAIKSNGGGMVEGLKIISEANYAAGRAAASSIPGGAFFFAGAAAAIGAGFLVYQNRHALGITVDMMKRSLDL